MTITLSFTHTHTHPHDHTHTNTKSPSESPSESPSCSLFCHFLIVVRQHYIYSYDNHPAFTHTLTHMTTHTRTRNLQANLQAVLSSSSFSHCSAATRHSFASRSSSTPPGTSASYPRRARPRARARPISAAPSIRCRCQKPAGTGRSPPPLRPPPLAATPSAPPLHQHYGRGRDVPHVGEYDVRQARSARR